jgi:hypothetical protein
MLSKEQANAIIDAMQADDGDALQTILGNAIQSNQITKDDANALIDAMQADDGEAVETTLTRLVSEQRPLALRPPEDFSPQYTPTEQVLKSLFPRLSTEGGDNILSDVGYGIGDALSLGGRQTAGLVSGWATAGGALMNGQGLKDSFLLGVDALKDQMQSRGATDPNAKWYDPTALAETVLKDPTVPLIPATGGLSSVLTRGISSPLLRGATGGATEGLLSGLAGAGMEQRGLQQELINTGVGMGAGGLLGAGLSPLIPKAVSAPTPPQINILQQRVEDLASQADVNPATIGNAVDELAKARRAVATTEEVELPWYMPRNTSGTLTPDRPEFDVPMTGEKGKDVPFAMYQARADEVKNGLRRDDPFFMATQEVLIPAVEAVKKQRQVFGSKIDQIENVMSDVEMDATPIKSIIADELDKANRRAVVKDVLDEDGDVVDQVVEIQWKPNIQRSSKQSTKSLSPEMVQITEDIALLDDNVNFGTLRSVVRDLEQVIKRSATPDPLAQSMLKSLQAKLKTQIRGTIEAKDPNLLTEWDGAMKGYAERSQLLDEVKKRTGINFKNAEGWLKSMVTTGARGSDDASRKIMDFTGYDVGKASAYARYANETAGIKERGASLLNEVGKPAETAEKSVKQIPVVSKAVETVKAVVPQKKATAGTATRAVAESQQKRTMTGAETDDFFKNYFKKVALFNNAASALIPQERNK